MMVQDGELMVTGTSDGAVAVYNLLTREVLERLSQASSMVYQVWPLLYCTVLYCTVLHCTVLYLHHAIMGRYLNV